MVIQDSPNLKIMRLLEPNLDTNCVELLDIYDCVETVEKFYRGFRRSCNHIPILRIPSYSNDVLLGEKLKMVFVLGNNTKTKFSDVYLKVEMVMENEDTETSCILFEGLQLKSNCNPVESHYTYLFTTPSRYRMTCSVEFSSRKGPHILKKMFMWNCTNPVQLYHSLIKMPNGLYHLETRVKNESKTLLVLKELKLEDKKGKRTYSPIVEYNKDNICLLRPDEIRCIIFPDIPLHSLDFDPSSENAESDCEYYMNINWHSYTNISGTNVSKVNAFCQNLDLFFKVEDFPKSVKLNEPFIINLFLKNLTKDPLEVWIKFKNTKDFILQCDQMEKISLDESQSVSLPFLPLTSGLNELKGIEIQSGEHVYSVENLQILID